MTDVDVMRLPNDYPVMPEVFRRSDVTMRYLCPIRHNDACAALIRTVRDHREALREGGHDVARAPLQAASP